MHHHPLPLNPIQMVKRTARTRPIASTGAEDEEGSETLVSATSITNPLTSLDGESDGCCLRGASLPNPAGMVWLWAADSPLE